MVWLCCCTGDAVQSGSTATDRGPRAVAAWAFVTSSFVAATTPCATATASPTSSRQARSSVVATLTNTRMSDREGGGPKSSVLSCWAWGEEASGNSMWTWQPRHVDKSAPTTTGVPPTDTQHHTHRLIQP